MKRILKLGAIAIFLAFALSSCLTIEDHYTLKANGSGTMKSIYDMSEMKGLMQMAMSESEEGNPMDEINFEDIAVGLRGMDGISNVSAVDDKEAYIFEVQFDFDNMEALNTALVALGRESNEESLSQPSKNTFSNKFKLPSALPLNDLLGEGGEEMEQAKMFLGQIKYKIFLDLQKPAQAIYADENALVSFEDKAGKKIQISTNFAELMKNSAVLDWTVVTK